VRKNKGFTSNYQVEYYYLMKSLWFLNLIAVVVFALISWQATAQKSTSEPSINTVKAIKVVLRALYDDYVMNAQDIVLVQGDNSMPMLTSKYEWTEVPNYLRPSIRAWVKGHIKIGFIKKEGIFFELIGVEESTGDWNRLHFQCDKKADCSTKEFVSLKPLKAPIPKGITWIKPPSGGVDTKS